MKIKALVLCLLLASSQVFPQSDSTGLFLNSKDFARRHLTYATSCEDQKHPIKLGSLFNQTVVMVNYKEEKLRLNKSELYGFKDCSRRIFRFYKDSEYRIISTISIYLYFREEESGTGKNTEITDLFFFSVTMDSDLVPLTKENLRVAYGTNDKFLDAVENSFKDDIDLSTYDKTHKRYRLVRLYEESLK